MDSVAKLGGESRRLTLETTSPQGLEATTSGFCVEVHAGKHGGTDVYREYWFLSKFEVENHQRGLMGTAQLPYKQKDTGCSNKTKTRGRASADQAAQNATTAEEKKECRKHRKMVWRKWLGVLAVAAA